MSRLPTPGGDDGSWGDVLNDFLNVEHNADGTQKALSPSKLIPGNVNQVLTTSGGSAIWVDPANNSQTSINVTSPTGIAATDTANVQAALTAANTAGGAKVILAAGTYLINTTLVLYSYTHLTGAGMDISVLKLDNGANVDLVNTYQFSSLKGTTNGGGVTEFSLTNLTLDGNYAGQVGGLSWPLRIYGYAYNIDTINIKNGAAGGAWSEWRSGADPVVMESHWHNVRIYEFQGGPSPNPTYGLYYDGPHDSSFSEIFISSLAAHHAGNGTCYHLYVGANALSIVCTNSHFWGRSDYCVYLVSATCFFANCFVEGAFLANVVMSTGTTWLGGYVLGTSGNSGNQPNEVGFQIGTAGTSCHAATIMGVYAGAFVNPGYTINFLNDGGNIIRYSCNVTPTSVYTGTPSANSTLEIIPWNATSSGLYQGQGQATGATSQVFTSSGTWTKPNGCTVVQVHCIGGGGGGQAGGRQASGVISVGGSGGGSGGFSSVTVPASAVTSFGITVGTGGSGGIANATDSSTGAVGGNGISSTAGNITNAGGGTGGQAGNGGAGGIGMTQAGGAGVTGLASGLVAANTTNTGAVGAGGAGGGITVANAVANGSKGAIGQGGQLGGGTGGAGVGGGNGGSNSPNIGSGGGGGGGGASGLAGGFTGGNGGTYGGGGGGGGASQNSAASGAGGNGGNGVVIVSTW